MTKAEGEGGARLGTSASPPLWCCQPATLEAPFPPWPPKLLQMRVVLTHPVPGSAAGPDALAEGARVTTASTRTLADEPKMHKREK